MDMIGDVAIEAAVAVVTLLAVFPLFGFYAGVAENLKTWAVFGMILAMRTEPSLQSSTEQITAPSTKIYLQRSPARL